MADTLTTLIPPNLKDDSTVSNIITALEPDFQLLASQSHIPEIVSSHPDFPLQALDALALQFHADFHDLAANDTQKQSILRNSLTWHMRKGTPSAIIDALASLGISAEFIPWWEFDGLPYTFRIKAEITGDFYRTVGLGRITRLITRAVNEAKSARSLMADLDTRLNFSERLNVTAALIRSLSGQQIIPASTPQPPKPHKLFWAGTLYPHGLLSIPLNHERKIITDTHAGIVRFTSASANIGVDLSIMQELLLQFEKRIFSRIDDMERSINDKFDTKTNQLDAKIDSVIELLRWKGPDEEL